MKNKTPTIQDVARIANVSVATVSRALQKPDIVSESKRQTIMQAVEEVGYHINSAAQRLRKDKSDAILVVLPDIKNPFFSEIFAGIEDVASQHGLTILVGNTNGSDVKCERLLRFLDESKADGALLLQGRLPSNYKWKPNRPIVTVSEPIKNTQFSHVGVDHKKAAYCATEHLISLGHKYISYMAGPENSILTEERKKGYVDAMAAHNLNMFTQFITGDFSVASGADAIDHLIEQQLRATAIFCANDDMAIGAIHRLKHHKIRVPEDISIIGFDDIQYAKTYIPAITTIRQPRYEIGRRAMMQLIKLFADPNAPQEHILLPFEMINRQSTQIINEG